MHIVNIHEAKTHLSRLLEEVAAGEEIIIAKAGKPTARLIAYIEPVKVRTPGVWKGQVFIAEDFDELPEEVLSAFNGETV